MAFLILPCWCFPCCADTNSRTDAKLSAAIAALKNSPGQDKAVAVTKLRSLKLSTANQYFRRAEALDEEKKPRGHLYHTESLQDAETGFALSGGKHGENYLLLYRMQHAWYARQNAKLADVSAKALLKKYPSAKHLLILTDFYNDSGRRAKAFEVLERACALYGTKECYDSKTNLLLLDGRYEEALRVIDTSLRKWKGSNSRHQRAIALLLLGREEEAKKELETLAKLGQRYSLGEVQTLAERVKGGHGFSQDVAASLRSTEQPIANKDMRERIAKMEQRLKGKPGLSYSEMIDLGELYLLNNQLEEALQWFTDLAQSHPDQYQAYYYRAAVYTALDRTEEAKKDRRTALELFKAKKSGT